VQQSGALPQQRNDRTQRRWMLSDCVDVGMELRDQKGGDSGSFARRPNTRLRSLLPGLPRTLEELIGLHLEGRSELLDHVDACAVDAALEQADICPVDACQVSQFFLRKAFGLSESLQIVREDFPDVHDRRMRSLSSMLPRSILLKIEAPEIGKVDIAESLVNAGLAGRRDSLPSDAGLVDTVEAGIHA
jgi:hypothetical protein